VSSAELVEWRAYYELEPFGQARGDLQAGIVASTVVNLFRSEDAKPVGPSDFLLKIDPTPATPAKPERPSWEGHLAFAESMVAMGYGTITTNNKEA
jgi:hypothetical protein